MSEEELIVNAGRESAHHAIKAVSALDPSALEHLHNAARRTARAYYVVPPLAMLTDLVRLRNTVYEQLDRTHKPRQQAELYYSPDNSADCYLQYLSIWGEWTSQKHKHERPTSMAQ